MDSKKIAGFTFEQFSEAKRVLFEVADFADRNALSEDEALRNEASNASLLISLFSMAFNKRIKRMCEKQIARIDREKTSDAEKEPEKPAGVMVVPFDSSVKS